MPVTFKEKTQKWVADYTDQFGKRHRHGFDTKREAKDHLVQREAAIRDRSFRPAATKTKLADVARMFLEESEGRVRRGEIEPTTHGNYKMSIEIYILASRPQRSAGEERFFQYPLGNMAIGDITDGDIKEFRGRLIEWGMKSRTVRHQLLALSLVLGFARERKLISENVAKGYPIPKSRREDHHEIAIPEKSTVASLLELSSPVGRLMIMFSAATGVRSSELRGLMCGDIDLAQRKVVIRRRADQMGKLGMTKSRAGRRSIPLPQVLVSDLAEYRERSKYHADGDFVFHTRKGTPILHSNLRVRIWNVAWAKLHEKCKAEGVPAPAFCNWHSLRHFAISTWIEKNIPVKQVQLWAGHSSAALTLNTYSHVFAGADHTETIEEIAVEIWE